MWKSKERLVLQNGQLVGFPFIFFVFGKAGVYQNQVALRVELCRRKFRCHYGDKSKLFLFAVPLFICL